MSDQFLRLVARLTKFDKRANATATALDFFAPTKPVAGVVKSNGASAATTAALDFFGSASTSAVPEAPTAAKPASSKPPAAKSNTKQGTKRSREVEEEETEGDEHEEGQFEDDGGNDLEDADAAEEDGEEDGVQIFGRSTNDNEAEDNDETGDATTTNNSTTSATKRLKEFRRQAGIHVQGSDIPPPFARFEDLRHARFGPVPQYILDNLARPIAEEGCGYAAPTPIQQQAIPIMLKGRELLACAPTGSGKTAAFVVPILSVLKKPEKVGFRALVLAPTRELAEQTHRCFTQVSRGRKFKIFHLNKANANANTFGAGAQTNRDVLITTPMRLVHLLEQEAIDLSHVEFLVMDEADRLFELGFLEQVDAILAACTHPRLRRALFSATMEQGVEQLARTVLQDPIRLTIGARNAATSSIKQELKFVSSEEGKLLAFRQMIQSGLAIPVLIFVQSKERASQLYSELVYENINVDVIHAERTQHQRDESIRKFRSGAVWCLICTDLMARGIDFKGVNTVVNFDFPQDTVSYIHRIGRTGRGGREGRAITFFTEVDKPLLPSIARLVHQSGSEVPEWMLQMQKIGTKKAKKLRAQAPPRASIAPDPEKKAAAAEANKRARDRKKKRKLAAKQDGAASAKS